MLPISAGIGLKPAHFNDALKASAAPWFEVHPENYMIAGGPRLAGLLAVREQSALSLHGVGASLGGPLPVDKEHLARLRRLVDLLEPAEVSEHATWSSDGDQFYSELLPIIRTGAAQRLLADNIGRMQGALGRRILVENPACYLPFQSEMNEVSFLLGAVSASGAGLLLDVNNLYVSEINCGVDARTYIDAIPRDLVGEIHIAGHDPDDNLPDFLIDSHGSPVAPPVWSLLSYALAHLGPTPVLLERDANVPSFDALLAERDIAASHIDFARDDCEQGEAASEVSSPLNVSPIVVQPLAFLAQPLATVAQPPGEGHESRRHLGHACDRWFGVEQAERGAQGTVSRLAGRSQRRSRWRWHCGLRGRLSRPTGNGGWLYG